MELERNQVHCRDNIMKKRMRMELEDLDSIYTLNEVVATQPPPTKRAQATYPIPWMTIYYGNLNLIEELLKSGKYDPNLPCSYSLLQQTPMDLARQLNNTKLIELLSGYVSDMQT
jgi:hypothetical protein